MYDPFQPPLLESLEFMWNIAELPEPLYWLSQKLCIRDRDHLYLFLRLNNSETFVDEAF